MIEFSSLWIFTTLLCWALVFVSHKCFSKQTDYKETEFVTICFISLIPFVNLLVLIILSTIVLFLSFKKLFEKIYWRLK